MIYSKPVIAAHRDVEYRYELHATRSLGDLSQAGKGPGGPRLFRYRAPAFALEKGPEWLKIDPLTGVLSGKANAAGEAEVAVTVTIDQPVREARRVGAEWGNEKVLGVETQRVGSYAQTFVLRVE